MDIKINPRSAQLISLLKLEYEVLLDHPILELDRGVKVYMYQDLLREYTNIRNSSIV